MKIGIMSDSHRDLAHTRLLIDELKSAGAQYLIHAGDFERLENLRALHESGLEYVGVFGNNDLPLQEFRHDFAVHNEPHYFTIGGLRFKLMHMPFYLSRDADVIIYGHTHQVRFKYNEGLLLLNPGELCARESGRHEALLLEVETQRYRVTHLYKEESKEAIEKTTTEFMRE